MPAVVYIQIMLPSKFIFFSILRSK